MSLVENHVISNQLRNTVVGKTIVKTVANQNQHNFVWFATEPQYVFSAPDVSNREAKKYDSLLTGKAIKNSDVHFGGYGTYNFLYIGDRALMFSLPARYYAAGEKPPKRHQLYLTFNDGSSLAMCASLGGMIYLFKVNKEGLAIDYLPPNFPSVLSDDFSESFFLEFIKNTDLTKLKPAKTVKCFLAAKNRIPGLDNSILHEILWEAKVNPKSVMSALGQNDYKRLYTAIKKVFPAAIKASGRDNEKDLFGNNGGYITRASKNTLGKPCKRCSEKIVKEAYMGGVVYYCPKCQPIFMIAK